MQEFKRLLREDTIDYATYTANIKRKHPTPRSSRSGKAARGKGEDGEDEDDDDDNDWTGGSRRLNFSNQKTNGGRVTRLRCN